MDSRALRASYLDFFSSRGHTVVESSSLIPHGDPTLLFTNAGMVQFKDVFLGHEKRPYNRATTAQKCVRAGGKHNDLDEVGRTARHHTFFEMMGNFSFGDYFKEDAIAFAWEYLTKVLGLAKERLYFTVFEEDDEAARIWSKVAGIPTHEVVRLGAKDNFWAMGDTGPCGPCSEIIVDRGEEFSCGPDCHFPSECDRYLEVWNLVFMQYDRDAKGTMVPLPRPSVDTGMGLERMAGILQGTPTNWETDVFTPLLNRVAEISGQPYGEWDAGFPMRVVADHARAGAFLIADGVLPANDGRGYVLRRILRRAVRMGRLLGMEDPFLSRLLPVIQETMGGAYPEILERASLIEGVLSAEEERFGSTLEEGSRLLEKSLSGVGSGGTLKGSDVFLLYDTYGFPVDLTEEIARGQGKEIDRDGFGTLLKGQKERARAARDTSTGPLGTWGSLTGGLPATRFTGYEGPDGQGRVLAVLVGEETVEEAPPGLPVGLILDETPFYGEGGGQVGDTGRLSGEGLSFSVSDTRRLPGDRIVHLGRSEEGAIHVGDVFSLHVDGPRRHAIQRNHTATHLLHKALREVLGDHVHQAGSVVEPDRLRFDFTHFQAISDGERQEIEDRVNAWVLEDRPVTWERLPIAEAKSRGAMALFEEKYGDRVRMVQVEDHSLELCGGTHVSRTGEIGLFKITSESSVGSGLRRIQAVTGLGSLALLREKERILFEVAKSLKAPEEDILPHLQDLHAALAQQQEAAQKEKRRSFDTLLADIRKDRVEKAGVFVTVAGLEGFNLEDLRSLADLWRQEEKSGILALASPEGERVHLLAAVTKDLVSQGVLAKGIFDPMAGPVEGRGGGRPELAQGSGTRVEAMASALGAAREAALGILQKTLEAEGRAQA